MVKDVRFGDIVEYDVTTYFNDGGSRVSLMFGRICGKLTDNSSFALTNESRPSYLIGTCYELTSSEQVDSGVRRDHEVAVDFLEDENFELEWGHVPSKVFLIFLEDRDFTLSITPEASKYFKQYGRCPRCGDVGFWKAMACFCSFGHGKFIG